MKQSVTPANAAHQLLTAARLVAEMNHQWLVLTIWSNAHVHQIGSFHQSGCFSLAHRANKENASKCLFKNPSEPSKAYRTLEKRVLGKPHVQGWFTEAAAEIAALPGAGASPVTILLGELVTSILDSFHLNTPALKGAADQTRQPTGFLN